MQSDFEPCGFLLSIEILDNDTGKIITDQGTNTPDIDHVIFKLKLAIERCEEFKRLNPTGKS